MGATDMEGQAALGLGLPKSVAFFHLGWSHTTRRFPEKGGTCVSIALRMEAGFLNTLWRTGCTVP
jgi:hypothetical protein